MIVVFYVVVVGYVSTAVRIAMGSGKFITDLNKNRRALFWKYELTNS
tara:strand:+ start:99955 stop:100095 length:141 start_codon:yes stop_codon:yes gene_type:complete